METAKLKPHKPQSQSLKAQLALRDLVLGGALPPGERLFEVPLAARLGLSRTPLRAALVQLEQEGLLERASGGGFGVRKFSFDDVIDAIELRGVMEGTAARLAAERGSRPELFEEIKQVLVGLDAALIGSPDQMDFDSYVVLNARFHALLSALSGSALMEKEVARAMRLPFASPSAFLTGQEDVMAFRLSLSGAHAQHHALVEAIEQREGMRAEAIAREHARLARMNLEYVLNEDRSLMQRVPALALVSD